MSTDVKLHFPSDTNERLFIDGLEEADFPVEVGPPREHGARVYRFADPDDHAEAMGMAQELGALEV